MYRMNGKIWYVPQVVDYIEKLNWLEAPLPHTGEYIEGIRMVWHNERRVRYQDLSFGEGMRKTGTYYKTRAHRNAIMKQLSA